MDTSPATQQFIDANLHAEVAALALRGAPQGVDLPFALRQIEGRQTAERKLPRWAAVEGIVYPVRLSMQQCSSQTTAEYKATVVHELLGEGEAMADLTGGLGVDFSFLAPLFRRAIYVERDAELCRAARHNIPLLGLKHAEVMQMEVTDDTLPQIVAAAPFTLLYLDPARRDGAGRKMVRMTDCQPDLVALHRRLLDASPWVMAKLSPMLDISAVLHSLQGVAQVHVVGAEGECKELLVVLHRHHEGEATIVCGDLRFTRSDEMAATPSHSTEVGRRLYEPSAAMMKAAPFRLLSERYGVAMLHPESHLYTCDQCVAHWAGRTYEVCAVTDVKSFRRHCPDIHAAGITVRHYPDTPEGLRRRLKLREGADHQVVATTLADGRHVLIVCRRSGTPQ